MKLIENISDIYGSSIVHLLDPIDVSTKIKDTAIIIEGYLSKNNSDVKKVSKEDSTFRGSGDRQFLFVNKRPVDFSKGI